LVECKLPKLDAAGSSPVARSIQNLLFHFQIRDEIEAARGETTESLSMAKRESNMTETANAYLLVSPRPESRTSLTLAPRSWMESGFEIKLTPSSRTPR
jgi:hypothetical protein